MFYTDAYVKKDGKIDTVKILELQRTSAKAEYQGKKFDSTYDKQSKMFFVEHAESEK